MFRRLTLAALAVLPLMTIPAEAQKKTAIKYVPVTATFRCPLEADCVTPDAIQGDNAGPYTGQADGLQGPVFTSEGKLYWPIKGGLGRTLTLHFGTPAATPECVATNNCRKAWDSVLVYNSAPPSLVTPVGSDGLPLAGGFDGIAVGTSVQARYKLNFDDPNGRALLWTVRFNSKVYPGSSDVTVTRTSVNTWVVEAEASDLAELVSIPTTGRQLMVSDGYYAMPFRMTVVR